MSRRPALLLAAAALLGAATTAPALTAPAPDVIRVKGVGPDTVVSLLASEGGGRVPLRLMARLLGGGVDSTGPGQWRFTLYGTSLELFEGLPFAGYNGFVLPLLESTVVVRGAPHVSLQLFSEILPRFGIGVLWDRSRSELRLFQSIARAPSTPGSTTPAGGGTPAPPRSVPSAATVVATTSTSGAAASSPSPAPRRNGLSRRYTVAVDAGHGGRDPGNMGVVINGRRVNEAPLALAISLELEKALLAKGVAVLMTRRTDTLIDLYDRGPIANAKKADLFVSIHTNAANPNWRNGRAVRGFETFFLSTARNEDERRVAAMENDVVRFETNVETRKGDPLSFILNDLAANEHLRESSDLAQLVQTHLAGSHPGRDRGVKQSPLVVLATAYMPAVLVEVGFGTNALDARWMASSVGQKAIAAEIADAVFEYLQHYERRARAVIR